jgi:hypothetical protein
MATINSLNNASAPFTVSTGNLTVTSGNLLLPTTTSSVGQIQINSVICFHAFGTDNIFVGAGAGNQTFNTSHNTSNTAVGYAALDALAGTSSAEGNGNTAIGQNALGAMDKGEHNVAVGLEAGSTSTTAVNNVYLGYQAGYAVGQTLTGSDNIMIGYANGSGYTGAESSNILIGALIAGTASENNVLRIGNATGSSAGNLAAAYIQGIYGVTVSSPSMVTMASTGQLGTAAIPGTLTWTPETSAFSIVSKNGYICNHATVQVVGTLPATAAVGDTFKITNIGAAGWKVAQNASQYINFGNVTTTVGTGGSLASTAVGDSLEVICIVTNNGWQVVNSVGNITYV